MSVRFPDVWRLGVAVSAEGVDWAEAVLERFAEAVTMFMDDRSGRSDGEGSWRVEGFCRSHPDVAEIQTALELAAAANGVATPELSIERIENRDWVADNMRDFPPVDAGRFFVHGSHWDGRVPKGRIGLLMDAGTAFGSGEHATTKGCLLALDRLGKKRHARRVLDLGCGSGILAIAMSKMWACPALGSDIDAAAVRVAADNVTENGMAARVRVVVSDGWRNPALDRAGPYDVVCANILARPLCRLAPGMALHLAPGGVAVLSGLLERQERMVLAAMQRQKLGLRFRIRLDGWSTLVVG